MFAGETQNSQSIATARSQENLMGLVWAPPYKKPFNRENILIAYGK